MKASKFTEVQKAFIDNEVRAIVQNPDGTPDVSLAAPPPDLKQVAQQPNIGATTTLNRIDGNWHQISILLIKLHFGQSFLPCMMNFRRNKGSLTQVLDGPGATWLLRFDVVKDIQMILNLPVRSKSFGLAG